MVRRILSWVKIALLVLSACSALLGWAYELGWFEDAAKTRFANMVNTQKEVGRRTPGFGKFLADFPPPSGVPPATVECIIKSSSIQFRFGTRTRPVAYALQYRLNSGKPTEMVADHVDVAAWVKKTAYPRLTLMLASGAVLLQIALAFCQHWSGRHDAKGLSSSS